MKLVRKITSRASSESWRDEPKNISARSGDRTHDLRIMRPTRLPTALFGLFDDIMVEQGVLEITKDLE